jgi:hypothetical protein
MARDTATHRDDDAGSTTRRRLLASVTLWPVLTRLVATPRLLQLHGPLAIAAASALAGVGAPHPARAATAQRREALPLFDTVEIAIPCRARLSQAAQPAASLRAEPAVLAALRLVVEGRRLRVVAGSFQSRSEVELDVSCPALARLVLQGSGTVDIVGATASDLGLVLEGSGEISATALNLGGLHVDSTGAGVIKVGGRSHRQTVSLAGAGDYRALTLESDLATLTIGGAASAELTVRQRLELTLDGAASVRYRGAASMVRRGSGAGTVEHLAG